VALRFSINTPPDYLFHRDVCSYGYFLLAPNTWDPAERTLARPLDLPSGIARLTLHQPKATPGAPITAHADRSLDRRDTAEARRLITRMLRLDDLDVAAFHRVDRRWKKSGRGRLFRSPTLFEDVVKTVTSCNVQWPSTIVMNRRLCEVVHPAFPSAQKLARVRPATLRARCRVGYRDARMVELAKLFARSEVDVARMEDPATPDSAVVDMLLELPGIGPYAAHNILQLLGRYSRLPLDTESVRHGKAILGMDGSDKEVMRMVGDHFEGFGEHKFRSYWFELWHFYESKRGPAWTWDPLTTGTTFTASQL
jgi:3-methyladenine DNA glycosylase/8-oxoguanine DNA glycosylase